VTSRTLAPEELAVEGGGSAPQAGAP
jgi:hypothetical protein